MSRVSNPLSNISSSSSSEDEALLSSRQRKQSLESQVFNAPSPFVENLSSKQIKFEEERRTEIEKEAVKPKRAPASIRKSPG